MTNMIMQMTAVLTASAAGVLGGVIGYSFGLIQRAAQRRNELRQMTGNLHSGWAVMPGSMKRVAFLMIALVVAQVGCPMLFEGDFQWIVSAGVVLGYAIVLYHQIRTRVKTA
jgi:membrane protein YqaA with SNARE-associated domain